jgi:hypothetical protein
MNFERLLQVLLIIFALCGCSPRIIANLTANKIGSAGGTSVSYNAQGSVFYSSVTVDLGSQFQATSICEGATIFGLSGAASCAVSGSSAVVSIDAVLASNIFRTTSPLTAQLTQAQEVTTYAGTTLPTGYDEVPNVLYDDDGESGGSVTYASRPTLNCGEPISMASSPNLNPGLIVDRMTHCGEENPSTAQWNGAIMGNSGQGVWRLVTRLGVNNEVWQDQRTGLLWSSRLSPNAVNWCEAAGNVQNAGGVSCIAGAGNQPATAVSYCTEVLTPIATGDGTAGSWSTTYTNEKGGMGANAVANMQPAVRWRLPTIHDYEMGEIDGVRFVMPDMGPGGLDEWSATINSVTRADAWFYYGGGSDIGFSSRTSNGYGVRCVGR